MNFLKKLGIKKETVTQVAQKAGGALMEKVFNHFTGGKTNSKGKPSMDMSQLLTMAQTTGITDNKLGLDDIKGIFGKIKGGFGGSGDKPAASASKDSDTVDFKEFEKGMKDMAEKKYEDEPGTSDEKLAKLESLIITDCDDFLKKK